MGKDVELEDLEKGDRVLFNDRKQPLTVSNIEDGDVWVEGPQGGSYVIYKEDDVLLTSKNESKRYSSLVEDLRKTGEWKNLEDGAWQHTVSGAEVRVEQLETGNWTVEVEGMDHSLDQPGMGYLSREAALEDARKLVESNPEG